MYRALVHTCNQFYVQLEMIYVSEFIRMIIFVWTYHKLRKTNISKKIKFKTNSWVWYIAGPPPIEREVYVVAYFVLFYVFQSIKWMNNITTSIVRFLAPTLRKMNGGPDKGELFFHCTSRQLAPPKTKRCSRREQFSRFNGVRKSSYLEVQWKDNSCQEPKNMAPIHFP